MKTGDVAKQLGVHPQTLRKWEAKGIITPIRTPFGQRRYREEDIRKLQQNYDPRHEYIYCRVSSKKQSGDLARQISFMQNLFPTSKVISDIGSGINFKRSGLQTLLEQLCAGDVKTIAVSYQDRLCRIGFEIFEQLATIFKCRIVVVNNIETSPEAELVNDLIEITTSFSARIHGLRRYGNEMSNLLPTEEETSGSMEAMDQTINEDVQYNFEDLETSPENV